MAQHPKMRAGYLGSRAVDSFFHRRLKKQRMFLKSGVWEKLATKDKAFVIAECFKCSNARFFGPDFIRDVMLPAVLAHPVRFAEGLSNSNTRFFFRGLGNRAELFFRALGTNSGKFVKRLYYKDQMVQGIYETSLARGISENSGSFIQGLGNEGLLVFDKNLAKAGKRQTFLEALGKGSEEYLAAVKKALA